jgi:hypothetical protein
MARTKNRQVFSWQGRLGEVDLPAGHELIQREEEDKRKASDLSSVSVRSTAGTILLRERRQGKILASSELFGTVLPDYKRRCSVGTHDAMEAIGWAVERLREADIVEIRRAQEDGEVQDPDELALGQFRRLALEAELPAQKAGEEWSAQLERTLDVMVALHGADLPISRLRREIPRGVAQLTGCNLQGQPLPGNRLRNLGVDPDALGVEVPERPRMKRGKLATKTVYDYYSSLDTLLTRAVGTIISRNPMAGADLGVKDSDGRPLYSYDRFVRMYPYLGEAVVQYNADRLDSPAGRRGRVRQLIPEAVEMLVEHLYRSGLRDTQVRRLEAGNVEFSEPGVRKLLRAQRETTAKGTKIPVQHRIGERAAKLFADPERGCGAILYVREDAAKPGWDRVVPLGQLLGRDMRQWMARRAELGVANSKWLYPYADGHGPIADEHVRDVLRLAEELAADAMCEELLDAGVDPVEVEEQVGDVFYDMGKTLIHGFRVEWQRRIDLRGLDRQHELPLRWRLELQRRRCIVAGAHLQPTPSPLRVGSGRGSLDRRSGGDIAGNGACPCGIAHRLQGTETACADSGHSGCIGATISPATAEGRARCPALCCGQNLHTPLHRGIL